jgi:hypothetical protein
MPGRQIAIAGCLLAVLAVGCSITPPTPERTPVPSGFIDLQTMSGIPPSTEPGVLVGCGGVGGDDAVVHGKAGASDPVWIEPIDGEPQRIEVGWPAGFRARFAPDLEIFDSTGELVAREGDELKVIGGSLPGPDGRFWIWEFNGRSYPCY